MTAIEITPSRFDLVKLLLAIAIVIGGVFGFHVYAEQYILFYRVVALLGVIAVALAIGYQTQLGQKLWLYFQDSRTELRKVVWPTRTETIQTTLIVVLVVVLAGVFLWLTDMFFGWAIQRLLAL